MLIFLLSLSVLILEKNLTENTVFDKKKFTRNGRKRSRRDTLRSHRRKINKTVKGGTKKKAYPFREVHQKKKKSWYHDPPALPGYRHKSRKQYEMKCVFFCTHRILSERKLCSLGHVV